MPHNPHADFSPTLKGYTGQEPFRFWCQLALPLTFDDSLSYYELLNKVVVYLNNTIKDVANVEENVDALNTAFNNLQNYVNTYFDELDIEAELRTVLDKMAEDGSLDSLLDPLVATRLGDVVAEQISAVVADQIDDVVEEQIGGTVSEQIGDVIASQMPLYVPEYVTDWLDENITPIDPNITPIVDDSLSVSGAAADAKVTGDKLAYHQEEIGTIANTVIDNDVAWSIGGVNNSSGGDSNTDYANSHFCRTEYLYPNIMTNINIDNTVKFKIYAYTSDKTFLFVMHANAFYTESVNIYDEIQKSSQPNNIKCVRIVGIKADDSTFETTNDIIDHINVEYSKIKEFFRGMGIVKNNEDLNNLKSEGHWFLSGTRSYTNSPLASGKAGTIEVLVSNENWLIQKITSYDGLEQWTRMSLSGCVLEGREWIKSEVNYIAPSNSLPNNTDLDNVIDFGIYFLPSKTSETAYVNSPISYTEAATMEVFSGNSAVVQRLTTYNNGRIYIRTSDTQKVLTGRKWFEVTVDNYIKSTNDTTDVTDVIQAMLNATGECRLGPGRFYITGIEIPDYGILSGCGEATLINLKGTQPGVAITLNNYCTVKDLKLGGLKSTDVDPSSTVGSRHGILYKGNAVDRYSPNSDRKFRGVIDNVTIGNFTGGGITCEDTGGRVNSNLLINNCHIYSCDAGIYIPSYSEYHRITNVSVMNCYYGCVCNGGNCNFANCSFSGNQMGLLMNNVQNSSHGTFSACSFNHDEGGTAIRLVGLTSGEIFTGCQIFYGGIEIDSCKGVCFIGANLGTDAYINVENSISVIFADCLIYDDESPLTESGNTALIFRDCYNKYAGTLYDPLA